MLVRAGGRELRSVAELHAALEDAAATRRLRLGVQRGADGRQVTAH